MAVEESEIRDQPAELNSTINKSHQPINKGLSTVRNLKKTFKLGLDSYEIRIYHSLDIYNPAFRTLF